MIRKVCDLFFASSHFVAGGYTIRNMILVSGILVGGFGIFLICLSILCVFFPAKAESFLSSFASSAQTHFLEMGLRLLAGAALIIFASEMWFSDLFNIFGWIIVATSVILLLLPWRLHQRFSERTIPLVIRYLKLFALGAFVLGTFVFYGMSKIFFSS